MVTDIVRHNPNGTDREIAMRRSPHVAYQGDGCGSELSAEQIPANVDRVTRWVSRGFSTSASLSIVGLRGPAAAQVIEAMGAE